jgi:DnaJ-class molecular chaperone
MEDTELIVQVKKGMKNGEQITFEGVAEQRPGQRTGDVVFLIKEIPHPYFKRVGSHLYYETELTLEALLKLSFVFILIGIFTGI